MQILGDFLSNPTCFLGYRHYKIVSSMDNYAAILTKLREEGIAFETDGGFELIPISPIEVLLIKES